MYEDYVSDYPNPDFEPNFEDWNNTEIFGCVCGIGSCIDGNSVNITGGYMGCQCADHFRPGLRGCVCSDIKRVPVYDNVTDDWYCDCKSGIEDNFGRCECGYGARVEK